MEHSCLTVHKCKGGDEHCSFFELTHTHTLLATCTLDIQLPHAMSIGAANLDFSGQLSEPLPRLCLAVGLATSLSRSQ
jgi:hypothetical protein